MALTIRALQNDDVPAVAALRRRAYRHNRLDGDGRLERALRDRFLRNPWVDPELPSLVAQADDGTVAGFIGVIPRPLVYRGTRARAAVASQLMVDPRYRGMLAFTLVRTFLEGPQDLSLSDVATDETRRLWERLGGRVSVPHSCRWVKAIRPVRHAISRIGGFHGARAVRLSLRPAAILGDWLARRRRRAPAELASPVHLDAEKLGGAIEACRPVRSVMPVYAAQGLHWILERIAEKSDAGRPKSEGVPDPGGGLLGCYTFLSNRGGASEVVQVTARRGQERVVLDHLFRRVWLDGGVSVTGQCDPDSMQVLQAAGCQILREGFWTLVNGRLADDFLSGRVQHSRLDGEWWLGF